eukprot:jgi/Undpi1/10915/HiC_scaffold_3.g01441.m1
MKGRWGGGGNGGGGQEEVWEEEEEEREEKKYKRTISSAVPPAILDGEVDAVEGAVDGVKSASEGESGGIIDKGGWIGRPYHGSSSKMIRREARRGRRKAYGVTAIEDHDGGGDSVGAVIFPTPRALADRKRRRWSGLKSEAEETDSNRQ